MEINLTEIYNQLEAWRAEHKITAENKKDYLINVMEEFGEISTSLRLYKKSERVNDNHELKCAKHFMINNICNIAVLTILAADEIPSRKKESTIDTSEVDFEKFNLNHLIIDCGTFFKYDFTNHYYFNSILNFVSTMVITLNKNSLRLSKKFQVSLEITMKRLENG